MYTSVGSMRGSCSQCHCWQPRHCVWETKGSKGVRGVSPSAGAGACGSPGKHSHKLQAHAHNNSAVVAVGSSRVIAPPRCRRQ